MAKVTAPLLSFASKGQIGKSVVFARWRGIDYARRHVVPANPQTTAQQLTRNTFATLREMYKLLPALGSPPWQAFAEGRAFLPLNAFVGENIRAVRGEPDLAMFIGSPGAKGGLPPNSVTLAAGGAAGEIDVTFTNPAPPPDWTLNAQVALAFQDQPPDMRFEGRFTAGSEVPPTNTVTLAGLDPVLHVVAAWLEWTKPNGDLAYSVGITGTQTPA